MVGSENLNIVNSLFVLQSARDYQRPLFRQSTNFSTIASEMTSLGGMILLDMVSDPSSEIEAIGDSSRPGECTSVEVNRERASAAASSTANPILLSASSNCFRDGAIESEETT
jgi:hypothetical protein